MLHPDASDVPPHSPNLDVGIKEDYLEARAIVTKSPREATALLSAMYGKALQTARCRGRESKTKQLLKQLG